MPSPNPSARPSPPARDSPTSASRFRNISRNSATIPPAGACPSPRCSEPIHAQHSLRLAAIGGKDSMSGSFNELDVPPTLVSFALAPGKASLALSPEFKTSRLHDLARRNLPRRRSISRISTNSNKSPTRSISSTWKEKSSRSITSARPASPPRWRRWRFGNHIGAEINTTPRPRSRALFHLPHRTRRSHSPSSSVAGTSATPPPKPARSSSTAKPTPSPNSRTPGTATLEPIYPTKPEEIEDREIGDRGCSALLFIHNPQSTILNRQSDRRS